MLCLKNGWLRIESWEYFIWSAPSDLCWAVFFFIYDIAENGYVENRSPGCAVLQEATHGKWSSKL